MNIKSIFLTCVVAFCPIGVGAQTLGVGVLRTQYMENPVGIDTNTPVFGWQLVSEKRSTVQASYRVEIATDRNMSDMVYDSGILDSNESANVTLDGLALMPSTRYYWRVTVTDNFGRSATSSGEDYFETGLMDSGWSGARWIRMPDGVSGTDVTGSPQIGEYTVEADFEIEKTAAGLCFARRDAANFYMWQFNVEGEYPRLRPHRWQGGNPACLDNIDLRGRVAMAAGTLHHVKIDIIEGGKRAQTYIDGVLVDDRSGDFGYGPVGFRQDRGERDNLPETAFFDNIRVTDAEGCVLFEEDFSGETANIDGGKIENGRLHVIGSSTETVYAWQKAPRPFLRYDIEADLTLINDAASIVFGYTRPDCYFMWAVNTNDRDYPLLRRHVYAHSHNPQFSDTPLIGFTKEELLGHEHKLRITVDGDEVHTYIDEILVDTFIDSTGLLTNGLIGFRVYRDAVNEEAYWDNVKVTVYDEGGNSKVSLWEDFENDVHEFSTGEVVHVDGNGKFHSVSAHGESRIMQDAATAAPRFRKEFAIEGKVKRARLYTSALGVYNVWINNTRVGSINGDGSVAYDELMPGWTDYRSTVFYMSHDVTGLLREGENAIGAMVSSGWWAGDVSHGIYAPEGVAFLAKLVVELENGDVVTVVTDTDWDASARGPVKSGEIYHGEIYDARSDDDWAVAGYDASMWEPASVDNQRHGKLLAHEGPTVRVRGELERKPVSLTVYDGIKANGSTYGEINVVRTTAPSQSVKLKKGETLVVDFGQNASGWAKFKVRGEAGTRVDLRYAEMVNDSGEADRGNDAPKGSLYTVALRSAKAMGRYTLRGDKAGETYAPTTTFYGFRYCDVTATDDVELLWITAETVGTVAEEVSSISVDNDDVNRLYSNILWGQRSNFLSIPTDCPQRDERLGWTADTQIFSLAASYNAQVQGFYHKWMCDMRDGQLDNGAYPNVAPFNWVEYGSCAWADAGIILPWNVYTMYGDKAVIEENYESMEHYMEWVATQKEGSFQYVGSDTRYGDWLAFEDTDKRFISVAHYGYMAQIMSRMSKALSKEVGDRYDVRAEHYAELAKNIKTEFRRRYINGRTGLLNQKSQCAQLLALKFDMLPDEKSVEGVIKDLRGRITANGNKLSTGFIGTGIINQTLSEYGMSDLAYALLLQHECPSWLYSVDQGATTIWERWNSYTRDGGFSKNIEMNSFNHYAYGAVGEWMYRHMAGIAPDWETPGFKHILLKPDFDSESRITNVNAVFGSNYGPVTVRWRTSEGGGYLYNVTVPANTTATLTLPSPPEGKGLFEGGSAASEAEGITDYCDNGQQAVMALGSGSYSFTAAENPAGLIKVMDAGALKVVPNPCTCEIDVVCERTVEHMELWSLAGTLVMKVDNTSRLNVEACGSGTYLLKVASSDGRQDVVKLIKL